jgi:hypothetical protein
LVGQSGGAVQLGRCGRSRDQRSSLTDFEMRDLARPLRMDERYTSQANPFAFTKADPADTRQRAHPIRDQGGGHSWSPDGNLMGWSPQLVSDGLCQDQGTAGGLAPSCRTVHSLQLGRPIQDQGKGYSWSHDVEVAFSLLAMDDNEIKGPAERRFARSLVE